MQLFSDLREEICVKDDGNFYNLQAFHAHIVTLFCKLREGDRVQIEGSMTIYTRVNASGYSTCTRRVTVTRLGVYVGGVLTWRSIDNDQHPALEYALIADVLKKYSLLKISGRDSAGLSSFETVNKVFKELHKEIYPGRPLPVFESKQITSLEKRIAKRRRLAHADSVLKIVATGLEESSIMDVLDTAKAVEEDLDVFFEEGDQNCCLNIL
ncbi:hypothetical protein AB4K20DRAFT_1968232 [Rhizopus microsporus]